MHTSARPISSPPSPRPTGALSLAPDAARGCRAAARGLSATRRHSGAIELRWRGTVANGTFYTVWRRLGDTRAFELLGSVSAKRFVDSTLPAATAEATYFLRTHRDELTSDPCEPIVVRLGVIAASHDAPHAGLGVAA